MGRHICVAGFASLSREWANELPDSVELWAMNEGHYHLKRPASRWFQVHPKNWRAQPVGIKAYATVGTCSTCGWGDTGTPDKEESVKRVHQMTQNHANKNPEHDVEFGTVRMHKNGYGRPPHHLKWLKNCGIPVYQQKVDPRIPTSVKFPLEEIRKKYGYEWVGGHQRPYLTSSAAYMIALAVYEHDLGDTVDTLYIAGIELAIGTEYFHQRPCVEHWLGIAVGRGIKLAPSPYGTAILQGAIYAVENSEPLFPDSMMGTPLTVPENAKIASVLEDEDGNAIGL